MHVTPLQESHATEYRRLMLDAYRLDSDAFTSTPEERAAKSLEWWAQRIADPAGSSAAFGAFDGGALVGTTGIEFSARTKTRHKALLIGMYVGEHHRRRGMGCALVDAALAHARARPGVLVVTLTVTEGNAAALDLYRSMGFVSFGLEPMAIATPDGFKSRIHMWLPLHPDA